MKLLTRKQVEELTRMVNDMTSYLEAEYGDDFTAYAAASFLFAQEPRDGDSRGTTVHNAFGTNESILNLVACLTETLVNDRAAFLKIPRTVAYAYIMGMLEKSIEQLHSEKPKP